MAFEKVFISIFMGTALIVGAMVLNGIRPDVGPDDWRVRGPQCVRATGKCAECHSSETPAIVHMFETSLCDHAQNGFFLLTEWIPVVSSAYAVAFFALAVLMPLDGSFLRACMYLAFAQAIVGAIGFLLHIDGISGGVSSLLSENILFGPPLFAPLLFSNLAVLVGIGL